MGNFALWGKPLSGTDKGQYRPLRTGEIPTDEVGGPLATSLGTILEHYLGEAVFKKITGNPSADQDPADLTGDGETFDFVKGYGVAEVGHMLWQGRIASNQTTLTSVEVGIKGTGDFRLKLYVEAAGPVWTLAYDSGLLPAGALAYTTISPIVPQPAGAKKRFHVVVEATVDSGEFVYATRPFVRQE